MRKAAVAILILIVVALAGLYLAPRFYDFDRYRPLVAEWASKTLGRPVTIAGKMSLELLPSPHVALSDVRIANPPGAGAPELARIREVSAALSFWPLLSGRIEVTSARLVRPQLVLDRPIAELPKAPAAAGGRQAAGAGDAATASVERRIRIARLSVEDGTLAFRIGDRAETLERIQLSITGDAMTTPLHVEGKLLRAGLPVTISLDLGRLGSAEVPISLVVGAQGIGSLDASGTVALGANGPGFAGKLTVKGEDFGALAARAELGALPPMLAKPYRFGADLAASASGVTLDRLVLDLGEIHGTGSLSAAPGDPPAVSLKLAVNSFDLDRYLAERKPQAAPGAPPAASAGAGALSAPQEPLRFDLPSGIAATVDLGVDAVVWRQGVIRRVHATATLAGGKLAVTHAGALLPGGSDVELSGELDTVGSLPRFSGSLDASADNLRDLLRWMGVAVEGVPQDRLRRATLQSRLELDGAVLEIRSIDLGVDAARLSGAATVALRERLALGARFTIDQLNLDAYLAEERAPAAAGASAPGAPSAPAPVRITVPGAAASALASIDANLDIAIAALIWRGQPIREIHFTGTLQNRDLTLRELSVGDLGGARGKLTGFVQGLDGDAPKAQAAFDMRGPELSRVLRLLAPRIASAEAFGEFSLAGDVVREGGRLSLDAEVDALGGKLHATGDAPTPDTWTVMVSLDHPSFNRLARLASPNYRPAGGELGAIKLRGALDWSPGAFAVRDLKLAIDTMTLGGDFRLALGDRPMLRANLTLGDLALDRFLPTRQTASLDPQLRPGVMLAQAGPPNAPPPTRWSRTPIDLGFLQTLDAEVKLGGSGLSWASWKIGEPKAQLALGNGVLQVTALSGRLFGGILAATGRVDAAAEPKLDFKASLTGADLRQALAAAGTGRIDGAFDVDASLATSGTSAFDLISRLGGKVALHGHDGTINGINLPAIDQQIAQSKGIGDLATLLRAATSGSTPFSRLDGNFAVTDGVARSNDLRLVAEGGEGAGTAEIDLPGWTLQSRTEFRLAGLEGVPPLGVVLRGALDRPDLSIDFAALAKALVSNGERGGVGKPKDILKDLLKRVK